MVGINGNGEKTLNNNNISYFEKFMIKLNFFGFFPVVLSHIFFASVVFLSVIVVLTLASLFAEHNFIAFMTM